MTFGNYIRQARIKLHETEKRYSLRQTAVRIGVEPAYLSKIERNERKPTSEMIPVLAETLDKTEKEIQVTYIKFLILNDLGDLKYLKEGLNETLKLIK